MKIQNLREIAPGVIECTGNLAVAIIKGRFWTDLKEMASSIVEIQEWGNRLIDVMQPQLLADDVVPRIPGGHELEAFRDWGLARVEGLVEAFEAQGLREEALALNGVIKLLQRVLDPSISADPLRTGLAQLDALGLLTREPVKQ